MKVAVMSNKGGVGKTTISINIAYTLKALGKRVALLDVDFHGPNLPVLLGVHEKPRITPNGIEPVEHDGVQVMSLHFILKEDDEPCLWSGETKRNMVIQFIEKSVLWKPYDVMVIDTPPSLGDESLVVADLADKIIVVTTPHPASVYDIRKMLRFLKDKVKAIVINMFDMFSFNNVVEQLKRYGVPIYRVKFDPLLQRNPRNPVEEIRKLCEEVILA